jgi:hypothetical protein
MKPKDGNSPIEDLSSMGELLALAQVPKIRDFMSSFGMCQSYLDRDERPEWVIRAADDFFRTCLDFPKSKYSKTESYRLGYMLGMAAGLPRKGMEHEPKLNAHLAPERIKELIPLCVADAQTHEMAEFCRGVADGTERSQNFNPSSRCVVYLLLCMGWQEVSTLKNVGEIHAWLKSIIGTSLTGERDRIAKICQKIRLPLDDKGGRPKKPRKEATR